MTVEVKALKEVRVRRGVRKVSVYQKNTPGLGHRRCTCTPPDMF